MQNWTSRNQIRPEHAFGVLVMFTIICSAGMLLDAGAWSHILLPACSIGFLAWIWMISCVDKNQSLIRMWGWITNLTPVKVMQFDHSERLTLVKRMCDGSYEGYLGWQNKTGAIRLLPNGHVDPGCEASFCYVWQPLCAELRTELQLAHWQQWPDWHAWSQKSHQDMIYYRHTHLRR
jgi:hypothetical protein